MDLVRLHEKRMFDIYRTRRVNSQWGRRLSRRGNNSDYFIMIMNRIC